MKNYRKSIIQFNERIIFNYAVENSVSENDENFDLYQNIGRKFFMGDNQYIIQV